MSLTSHNYKPLYFNRRISQRQKKGRNSEIKFPRCRLGSSQMLLHVQSRYDRSKRKPQLSPLSPIPFKPQMSLKHLKNSATAGKLELFIDFANLDISEYKQL